METTQKAIKKLNDLNEKKLSNKGRAVGLPLETTNGKYGKKVFECSECGMFHFSTAFCPVCGAKMDGV